MALTIRLSGRIQDALGLEAAEDLMDWMRSVEDRQSALREVHELTSQRFEARLDQRAAEIRGEIAEMHRDLESKITGFEIRLGRRFEDLMKWSFVFWATTLLALAAVWTRS